MKMHDDSELVDMTDVLAINDSDTLSNANGKNTNTSKNNPTAYSSSRTRSDGMGASWRSAYIVALSKHGTTLAACRELNLDRKQVYRLKKADPTFLEEEAAAHAVFAERLEEEAFRRAIEGSDRLLEFLLKGALPQKYKESAIEIHTTPLVIDLVRPTTKATVVDPIKALPEPD